MTQWAHKIQKPEFTVSIYQWIHTEWARSNDCPWDRMTCAFAAKNGHLDVLQWARANGCPWDELTCVYAAENGHLDGLQWARANGCEWDYRTCSRAAKYGHLSVLQWARENGCPQNNSDSQATNGYSDDDAEDDVDDDYNGEMPFLYFGLRKRE